MQVVENWAVLAGTLVSMRRGGAGGAVDGHVAWTVRVARVEDVDRFPNLLRDAAGTDVLVQVPSAAADEAALAEGLQVAVRARRAGPQRVFAHPDGVDVHGR